MKFDQSQFLIIGKPVSHSLSPAMHNAAFKFLKLPYRYEKLELAEKEVSPFIHALKDSNVIGLNVTVPYKELVFNLLGETQIDEKAKKIAAINTIHLQNGKLKAYNTDARGYTLSLMDEKKFNLKNKKVILLGAGGSAKALSYEMASLGVLSIHFINRSTQKATQLAKHLQQEFPNIKFSVDDWSFQSSEQIFNSADLIVNTTSIGLGLTPFPLLPWEIISDQALISDILYKPLITPFLQQAISHQHEIHQGLGMLLYQGALAFEIWTGQKAPLLVMKEALNAELKLS